MQNLVNLLEQCNVLELSGEAIFTLKNGRAYTWSLVLENCIGLESDRYMLLKRTL